MGMAQEIRLRTRFLDARLFGRIHVARGAQQTMCRTYRLSLVA